MSFVLPKIKIKPISSSYHISKNDHHQKNIKNIKNKRTKVKGSKSKSNLKRTNSIDDVLIESPLKDVLSLPKIQGGLSVEDIYNKALFHLTSLKSQQSITSDDIDVNENENENENNRSNTNVIEKEFQLKVEFVNFHTIERPPVKIRYRSLLMCGYEQTKYPTKKLRKVYKKYFMKKMNQKIIKYLFWYCFLGFFDPENLEIFHVRKYVMKLKDFFSEYFLSIPRNDKTGFFKLYHHSISYCIFIALKKTFPGSHEKFDNKFFMKLNQLISEILTGIRLRKSYLKKVKSKYFTTRINNNGKQLGEESESSSDGRGEKKKKKKNYYNVETKTDKKEKDIKTLNKYINQVDQLKKNLISPSDLVEEKKINEKGRIISNFKKKGKKKKKLLKMKFLKEFKHVNSRDQNFENEFFEYNEYLRESLRYILDASKSKNKKGTFSFTTYTMSPLISMYIKRPIEFEGSFRSFRSSKSVIEYGSAKNSIHSRKKHVKHFKELWVNPNSIRKFKESLLRQNIIEKQFRNSLQSLFQSEFSWIDKSVTSSLTKISKELKPINMVDISKITL